MRKTIKIAAVLAVLTLLMAACGDDDDTGSASGNTLAVTADSYQYTPANWSIPGNTDVTVTLTNANNIDEHEWAVLSTTITSEDEFSEDLVLEEIAEVAPGTSATGVFNLPPGTYQVICAVEGHFTNGMTGTLTVTG